MVVIVGAGIAGASSAYYLSSPRQRTTPSSRSSSIDMTIIDATGRSGACSSGRSGAYVSRHWADRTKRENLFHESFALHEELARDLNLHSFHYVSSYRVEIGDGGYDKERSVNHDIAKENWMDRVPSIESLQGPSAVVDPEELTKALVGRAVQQGATFLSKSVCEFDTIDNRVASIRFEDDDLLHIKENEDVVLALGPWSSRVEDWFHIPLPIDGVLSTSLIWDKNNNNNKTDISSPHHLLYFDAAVFCEEDTNGCHLEILPRYDGSLYVSGCGESDVLSPQIFRSAEQCPKPERPCVANEARVDAARKSLHTLLHRGDKKEERKEAVSMVPPPDHVQACIRPNSPDGVPVVGQLKPYRNVYVVTGGGPWGITFGPLMGKCLASLLLNNEEDGTDDRVTPPVRLASLAPGRFDTIMYRTFLEQRKSKP